MSEAKVCRNLRLACPYCGTVGDYPEDSFRVDELELPDPAKPGRTFRVPGAWVASGASNSVCCTGCDSILVQFPSVREGVLLQLGKRSWENIVKEYMQAGQFFDVSPATGLYLNHDPVPSISDDLLRRFGRTFCLRCQVIPWQLVHKTLIVILPFRHPYLFLRFWTGQGPMEMPGFDTNLPSEVGKLVAAFAAEKVFVDLLAKHFGYDRTRYPPCEEIDRLGIG